jgi:thiol-disulfide isomerase/thioredoxin
MKYILAVLLLSSPFLLHAQARHADSLPGAAFSRLVEGAILPGFTANSPDGKPVTLSAYRGKYVLLDFWASWCVPCRREFPYLKQAYARFKDKNFEILGYSIDDDLTAWVSAIRNEAVPWVQASLLKGANDPVALLYEVQSVPANWLIDPSGRVIATNLRGDAVEKKLAELIK